MVMKVQPLRDTLRQAQQAAEPRGKTLYLSPQGRPLTQDRVRELAQEARLILLAGRYTLLEQTSLDSFLPYCEERNISVIIGGPYNTGILATGAVPGAYFDYAPAGPDVLEKVSRIEAICRDHAVPLAAAALQFPLHHPAVASVIPGNRSVTELRRTLDNMAVAIPDGLWGELKSAGFLRQDAPAP